jgi:hypothetical protein
MKNREFSSFSALVTQVISVPKTVILRREAVHEAVGHDAVWD